MLYRRIARPVKRHARDQEKILRCSAVPPCRTRGSFVGLCRPLSGFDGLDNIEPSFYISSWRRAGPLFTGVLLCSRASGCAPRSRSARARRLLRMLNTWLTRGAPSSRPSPSTTLRRKVCLAACHTTWQAGALAEKVPRPGAGKKGGAASAPASCSPGTCSNRLSRCFRNASPSQENPPVLRKEYRSRSLIRAAPRHPCHLLLWVPSLPLARRQPPNGRRPARRSACCCCSA